MKNLLMLIFVLCSIAVFGQKEKKSIAIERANKKFSIVTKTIQIDSSTFSVTTEPLDTAEYKAQSLLRIKELELLIADYLYLAAVSDTLRLSLIAGLETNIKAGTYNEILDNELLNSLQGAWLLQERTGALVKEWQITINGANFTNGTAQGIISINGDKKRFTVNGFVASPLVLTKTGKTYTGNISTTLYYLIR